MIARPLIYLPRATVTAKASIGTVTYRGDSQHQIKSCAACSEHSDGSSHLGGPQRIRLLGGRRLTVTPTRVLDNYLESMGCIIAALAETVRSFALADRRFG